MASIEEAAYIRKNDTKKKHGKVRKYSFLVKSWKSQRIFYVLLCFVCLKLTLHISTSLKGLCFSLPNKAFPSPNKQAIKILASDDETFNVKIGSCRKLGYHSFAWFA